jgi:hypothetical protein
MTVSPVAVCQDAVKDTAKDGGMSSVLLIRDAQRKKPDACIHRALWGALQCLVGANGIEPLTFAL